MSKQTIPIKKALRWIILSTVIISGSTAFALYYYHYVHDLQVNNEHYKIISIRQNGPLSTDYLAELLGLSEDDPTNLYQYDTDEGRQKLLSCPWIYDGNIKKYKPGSLFVRYGVRRPIVKLADMTCIAVDRKGVVIPIDPEIQVPSIALGLEQIPLYGDKIENERLNVALDIYQLFGDPDALIDVSKADAESFGQREVVITFQREGKVKYVRLSPESYREGLQNFRVLMAELERSGDDTVQIFDFRVEGIGLLTRI